MGEVGSGSNLATDSKCDYRAVNNNPPLRIFELRKFPKSFIIYKKSDNFFVRFLLFTKKIACGGLLLFTQFLKLKFGPSGVDLF